MKQFKTKDNVIFMGEVVKYLGPSPDSPHCCLIRNKDGEVKEVYSSRVTPYDNKLQKEFQAIKNKVDQATNLLKEANDCARFNGITLNMLANKSGEGNYAKELQEICSVILDGAWSESTLSCRGY